MEIVTPVPDGVQSTCPFCGARSRECFRGLMLEKYAAIYASCDACASLHVVAPTWLAEAYADPNAGDALDTGAPWRARMVAGALSCLSVPTGPWLDFGSGRGLLELELHRYLPALTVVNHDPPRGIEADLGGPFALVGAFEVFEHCETPIEVLRQFAGLLDRDGLIVLSTWLRKPTDGAKWGYLAGVGGQHISFPSLQGLKIAADTVGVPWRVSYECVESLDLQLHVLSRSAVGQPALSRFHMFASMP